MNLGNCIIYAKYKGQKTFQAFSIEEGCCVNNIVFASTVDDSISMRGNLQKVADQNKEINVVFQLRNTYSDGTRKVVFQTK